MTKVIGLLGSGGQADETESYLDKGISVAFRAVSPEYADVSDSRVVSIDSVEKLQLETPVVAAVGTPGLRQKLIGDWKGDRFATVVSSRAYTDPDLDLGAGSVIAPGAVITTNVRIGNHVLINTGATIAHDCQIGDYATISPGVNIAGKVELGDGVFVGIGASISNGVKIASGCVVGAGAVVLDDVTEENAVVVGCPGKVVKTNQGWLDEL